MTGTKGLILMGVLALWAGVGRLSTLGLNETPSLPHRFYVTLKGWPAGRGHLVSLTGHTPRHEPPGRSYVKEVVGMPGDLIRWQGGQCWVAGTAVGRARPQRSEGTPLTPIRSQTIPVGYRFVRGWSADSYDSRYEDFGLVKEEHLQGRAWGVGRRSEAWVGQRVRTTKVPAAGCQ